MAEKLVMVAASEVEFVVLMVDEVEVIEGVLGVWVCLWVLA